MACPPCGLQTSSSPPVASRIEIPDGAGKLIRSGVFNDNLSVDGQIECLERLGGLLELYSRTAA
jgi:hypothetical protein